MLYTCAILESSIDGLRLEDARIRRYRVREPNVTSNGGVMADSDTTKYGGVGVDSDIVLDNRVTRDIEHVSLFVVLETLGTEGNTLIEGDVIADDGGFANDNARAVIDGEVLADLRTRMDVDARLGVSQLCDDARNDRYLQLMQAMSDAIVGHSVHDGIAEDDLSVVRSGRVGIKHSLNIGIKQAFDLRQRIDELHGQALGFGIDLSLGVDLLAILTKLESVGDLLGELGHQFLHVHTDVIRADGLVGLSLVEVVGEDDALHQLDDQLHLLHRWQRCLYGGHHARLFLTDFRQQRHITAQYVVCILLVHIGCKVSANRANCKINRDLFSTLEIYMDIIAPGVVDSDGYKHRG